MIGALVVGLLGAAVAALAAVIGHARGHSAGWRAATDAQSTKAAQVEANLARTDAASRDREAADVARIEAEGAAARETAGDQIGALIAEARERGRR